MWHKGRNNESKPSNLTHMNYFRKKLLFSFLHSLPLQTVQCFCLLLFYLRLHSLFEVPCLYFFFLILVSPICCCRYLGFWVKNGSQNIETDITSLAIDVLICFFMLKCSQVFVLVIDHEFVLLYSIAIYVNLNYCSWLLHTSKKINLPIHDLNPN